MTPRQRKAERRHCPENRVLGALFFATVLASASGSGAEAVQLRRDAVASLGGVAMHGAVRIADTAGLAVAGRAVGPGVVEWAGFWFPRSGGTSGLPEPDGTTPDGVPPDGTDPGGLGLPLVTRFLGAAPNPLRDGGVLRFDLAPVAAATSFAGPDAADPGRPAIGAPTAAVPERSLLGSPREADPARPTLAAVPVRIELFEANGRRTAVLLDAELPPGAHQIPLRLRGAANGVYFLRFTSAGTSQSRRVTVIR